MSLRYLEMKKNFSERIIRVLLLVLFILSANIVRAENCELEFRVISNNISVEVAEIESSVYNQASKISEPYLNLTPSTEEQLQLKYPNIFKLKNHCYHFPINLAAKQGDLTPEIKVCRNLVESKAHSNYKFLGVYANHALIEISGYEFWGFISVDLSNGLAFDTMGKPLTANGKTALSHSNYYGEEEIAISHLKENMHYTIGIDGWNTTESKFAMGVHYLKLENRHSPMKCKRKVAFLKIMKKHTEANPK